MLAEALCNILRIECFLQHGGMCVFEWLTESMCAYVSCASSPLKMRDTMNHLPLKVTDKFHFCNFIIKHKFD